MLRCCLFAFSLFLSLNSWSESPKRVPTPNSLPSVKCDFKQSFLVPNTKIRIYSFEIFTSRRGTGCSAEASWYSKCDVRNGETREGSDPSVAVHLKFRDNDTLKNSGAATIPMPKIMELGWITDRKGNKVSITESTLVKNTEIEGSTITMVAKRIIPRLNDDLIIGELQFFQSADPAKRIKGKFLFQTRCQNEITELSYRR